MDDILDDVTGPTPYALVFSQGGGESDPEYYATPWDLRDAYIRVLGDASVGLMMHGVWIDGDKHAEALQLDKVKLDELLSLRMQANDVACDLLRSHCHFPRAKS